MQVQTTTITTETTTAIGANFKVTTFEQTTTAFCDCCPNQSTGTVNELKQRGWTVSQGSEFCPECNY